MNHQQRVGDFEFLFTDVQDRPFCHPLRPVAAAGASAWAADDFLMAQIFLNSGVRVASSAAAEPEPWSAPPPRGSGVPLVHMGGAHAPPPDCILIVLNARGTERLFHCAVKPIHHVRLVASTPDTRDFGELRDTRLFQSATQRCAALFCLARFIVRTVAELLSPPPGAEDRATFDRFLATLFHTASDEERICAHMSDPEGALRQFLLCAASGNLLHTDFAHAAGLLRPAASTLRAAPRAVAL